MKLTQTKDYLLFIAEKAEIKRGDLFYYRNYKILFCTGINNTFILTDNKKPKHDSFGQPPSLCKKIIAYRKLNKEAKELDLPELPPFEGDVWVKGNRISVTTVYEYEERQDWPNHNEYKNLGYQTYVGEVIEVDKGLALKTDDGKIFKTQGTYWFGSILNQNCKLLEAAQSKQFSLEDMIHAYDTGTNDGAAFEHACEDYYSSEIIAEAMKYAELDREEFIQSLSTQQAYPKKFIPEYNVHMEAMDMPRIHIQKEVKTLKTITNSEGKQELVGIYKY